MNANEIIKTLGAMSVYEAKDLCIELLPTIRGLAGLEIPIISSAVVHIFSHSGNKVRAIKWMLENSPEKLCLREAKNLIDQLDHKSIDLHWPNAFNLVADYNDKVGYGAEVLWQ